MRIATMVSGSITTPQPFGMTYAPIDIAIVISEGLQKMGHTVDYYAPKGSHIGVPIINCNLDPFPLDKDGNYTYPNSPGQEHNLARIWDECLISEMIRRANAGEYDALIIHPIDRGLMYGKLSKNVPIIYTLHDPIVDWRADIYRRFLTPNQYLVSITNAQRHPAPELPYVATVYNGVNVDTFTFNEQPEDYVMFAGRMIEEKNPLDAIKAAKIANIKINLFGEVPKDRSSVYFNEKIIPEINNREVVYNGFVNRDELSKEYGRAKALLVPINWEEPFGLVITESMACGTPVIAYRRGSVPELIEDGKTGFIVDSVEEMAEAIKKIHTIDRHACREHVVKKFSNSNMIEGYNEVLRKVTGITSNNL